MDLPGAAVLKPDLIGAFLDKVLSRPPNARSAADELADRLSVTRLRNTFLVNARLTDTDPAAAARVLNAIVDAYLEQKQSPFSAAAAHAVAERDLPVSPQPSASEKMFMEMLAQNGLSHERSAIRVIAKAEPPRAPAGPKRLTLTIAAFSSGLAIAIALALLLERDALSSSRTDYVQRRLACRHVASLPASSRDAAEITPPGARLVLAAPDGRYATAVRDVEAELKRRRGQASRLVLVVSALPGEGAEQLASNLAHSLAVSGNTALLVDADLRLKVLTRLLAPQAASGLVDQMAAQRPIEQAILRDQTTGLCFLPASGPAPIPLSVSGALRAPGFAAAIRALRHSFPTIVVAAPPSLPVSDARIVAELADDIVFVTAWHKTPRRLAAKALALLAADQKKVLGAVLTGVPEAHPLAPMSFAEIFAELRQAALVNIAARAA